MPKKRYKILEYYNLLSRTKQEKLRTAYFEVIGLSLPQFYNDLRGGNITGDKLLFFSRIFGCQMEDLFTDLSGPEPIVNIAALAAA